MDKQQRRNCEAQFSKFVKDFNDNGFIPTIIIFQNDRGSIMLQPFGNLTDHQMKIAMKHISDQINGGEYYREPLPNQS